MLAVAFTFPAGRYHATPWDRHVNEGAVAWPPEPLRILRALIATWHHKVKYNGKFSEATLSSLIESLATELPSYHLPAASHSHTRHYLPQFAVDKTSLVLDAFTAVARNDPLTVTWSLDLPDDQRRLLDELLSVMGYLGRAESWVEAARVEQPPEPNCTPGDAPLDTATGELKGELVGLYVPRSATDYQSLRAGFLTDKKTQKKLGASLPESLLDALCVDTTELRKQGWSQPPAARKVSYLRPVDALRPQRNVPVVATPAATAISFVLTGKPLPRVEDSVRVGELMRAAVMHTFKGDVPPIISGHDLPKGNRHRHAFYLPWDSNGDGHLDRILVFTPDGIEADAQRAIATIRRLWDRKGNEWQLVPESIGLRSNNDPLIGRSEMWQSVTPYLHPWHVKKRLDILAQICRECRERGLPEPVRFKMLDQIEVVKGRQRRPIHFHRFRNKHGLHQPDRLGSFWRLTFTEPVPGPLALGFACHYGLGLFRPISSR
ncbi:MAG TPA: type I-U CRISPR-associated protein Csb2 [Rhodanobacteraceae bacterium]